jgi:hypothetical protein
MNAPAPRARLRGIQRGFAAHVRDPAHAPAPEGIEPRRMAVYAELCFNNVRSLLAANFPVIRAIHDDAAWDSLVRDFYARHRSRTPLFSAIAQEFIGHLEDRAREACGDPPWLAELARYEWCELALAIDEHELDEVACDPGGDLLDGIPCVSPLARVFAFRHPVHRIGPGFRPGPEDAGSPTLLLLVRDRADAVRFHEVDALTALLLERLAGNPDRSGRECVAALLAELGRAGERDLEASGIDVLQRLRARDALLGTRTAEARPAR